MLTGKPGTGKTSLVKQAVAEVECSAGGFYAEEIRSGRVREGFRLVTLDGEHIILAHVNIHSPHRVSKYGVDIDSLDRVGVSALYRAADKCDLVVIDEIGRMELFSANFRQAVSHIISSGKRVIGTIMLNTNPWADAIKSRPEVHLTTVTQNNHQQLLEELLHWLKATKSSEL